MYPRQNSFLTWCSFLASSMLAFVQDEIDEWLSQSEMKLFVVLDECAYLQAPPCMLASAALYHRKFREIGNWVGRGHAQMNDRARVGHLGIPQQLLGIPQAAPALPSYPYPKPQSRQSMRGKERMNASCVGGLSPIHHPRVGSPFASETSQQHRVAESATEEGDPRTSAIHGRSESRKR
ncbi:hypothetical protein IWZ03DRAFT_199268 [Phyllosticta citriasiana]|uniref:Uncharacterized protein n=1 Tax=Phyllosticta citriasiana TaxID=595635 RepID=A0ABR1KMY3_9PEZI